MNRIARFTFLLFAISVALGISYYVFSLLNKQPTVVEKAEKIKTTTIAVAVEDIQRGQKLTPEDIRFVTFLSDTLPKGTFSKAKSPAGRVAIIAVQASEPILENKLASEDVTEGGLATIISPNKRAMSVKVDQTIGVAGFIKHGQMVDVLVSIESEEENAGFITKTVLQNIYILETGTQVSQQSSDKKPQKINVVTLEVTPEESENLALAISRGRIVLALRGYTDKVDVLTKGATVPELIERYRTEEDIVLVASSVDDAPNPKPVPVVKFKKKFVVEVMNGSKVNSVTIKGR